MEDVPMTTTATCQSDAGDSGAIAGQPDNLFCLITHFRMKILPHVKT